MNRDDPRQSGGKPGGKTSGKGGASYSERWGRQQPTKKRAPVKRTKRREPEADVSSRRGGNARISRVDAQERLSSWKRHHRQMAIDSFRRMLKSPVASLMTWLVIAIALALPTGLYLFLNNAQLVSSNWDGAAQMSVYLKASVNDERGRDLTQELKLRQDVADAHFISQAQALEEFRTFSGFGDALKYLDDNPLPAVIVVRPAAASLGTSAVALQEHLMNQLKAMSDVDEVQLDLAWVKRLYSIMALGERAVTALALLLGVAVLLVVGNTIRLAIESRRQEIVVVKLVGGTNAFVRRPFLYTGIWYGLGGGVLAWLLINLALIWLAGPVHALASAYASDFELLGLGFTDSVLLLLCSTLLGWLGAWLAVGRHLGAIEPQ